MVCDRHFPVKLKGKIYRSIVRPALMYGSESWALNVKDERRVEVTEMKMLRWMCGRLSRIEWGPTIFVTESG